MSTDVLVHEPQATGRFRHDAMFYSGPQQFVAQTAAFVRDALEHDEPILVAVIEPRRSLLREELGQDAKHVEFLDMWNVGRNPARIIPAWRQWVERYRATGHGFRGIGEPIWAARSPQELVECQIHEQLLNTAFADGPSWWLMCPYDIEALPDPVIARARHTHPSILEAGRAQRSAHYPHHELTFAAMFAMPLPEPDAAHVLHHRSFGFDDLAEVRNVVETHARALGLAEPSTRDLVLVVNELATNSIRHGGGRGSMRLWREHHAMVCEVQDRGVIDDPLVGRHRPDPRRPGGAGLWMANQLCDLVQIRSTPDTGTTIRVHTGLT
jgi:anti-sigma regulatory factor (Ser/Thr protein kinase)